MCAYTHVSAFTYPGITFENFEFDFSHDFPLGEIKFSRFISLKEEETTIEKWCMAFCYVLK